MNTLAYILDTDTDELVEVDLRTLSTDKLEALSDEAGTAGDLDMVDTIAAITRTRWLARYLRSDLATRRAPRPTRPTHKENPT